MMQRLSTKLVIPFLTFAVFLMHACVSTQSPLVSPLPSTQMSLPVMSAATPTPLASAASQPHGTIAFSYDQGGVYRIGTIDLETRQLSTLTEPKGWGDGDPSWFAQGSRLVFVGTRNRAYELDIYTMNADGSEIRWLAQTSSPGVGSNFSPIVSPDGKKVVFHTNRDGNMEIYLADLDSQQPARNLSRHPANDVTPSWTPDGRGIIFSSDRTNGVYQLYVMDANGQNLRQFRSHPDFWNFRPKFSPSGRQILFGVELYLGGDHQIAVVNADGTGYRVVSQGIRQCAQGEWVGDDYIVCSGRQDPGEKWALYLISLSDLKFVKISPNIDANFRNPSWSAGKRRK